MAELNTVARPYAEAVFRLAKETGSLAAWSTVLGKLAQIASHQDALEVVANPQYTIDQVRALLLEMLGSDATPTVINFVMTVLENRRFAVLPFIAAQYEVLRAASEGEVEAHVESAFALSEAQLAELVATLSEQFKRKVNAEVVVNPALIGGVRVTVGDLVVDASVRGKLAQLATSLKS